MTNVGFLTIDPDSPSSEELAAWTFLGSCKAIRGRQISFAEIGRNPKLLNKVDVLWWHFDSSVEIPGILEDEAIIRLLLSFVDRGCGLLLSLLAAPYVVELGLESVRPNIRTLASWSEPSWAGDYPDMRGFAPFRGHPLFKSFSGGTFTWSPVQGNRYAAAYYENLLPAGGRVVAVEKCYIRLNEHRRIVTEYSNGAGTILTIGAHLYFSSPDMRFKTHRELFTEQCLVHLDSKPRFPRSLKAKQPSTSRTYWNFEPATVKELPATRSAASRRQASLPRISSDLEIHRDLRGTERNEFYSINGDTTLLMGAERGGIKEVWCHPVRIARDINAGFRIENSDLRWSSTLTPEVSIRPESFSRRYMLDEAVIEETIFADSVDPAGVVAYRIASPKPVEIVVTAIVDLRLMWPLSPRATGSLRYRWDHGLNAAIVSHECNVLCSIMGSSQHPIQSCLGQYSSVSVVDGTLVGEKTDQTQVAVGMRFRIPAGSRKLAIFVGGSTLGENEAVSVYRRLASDPGKSLKRRIDRFKVLERTSVRVQTPDAGVDAAIRWARWSLDRLFAFCPGLGRSLMAGYGLSSSGWNGGHDPSGRPGYAWYFGRDSVWACLAILDYGGFDRVREVLEFLGAHQDPDGKILHELTTSGFAHYDAADATPLYLLLMGRYVRASGDCEFARTQFNRVLKAMHFCFSTDTDGDHLIENTGVGHGWIEGGGLFPSHSEHYLASCWAQALEESAFVAGTAGKNKLRIEWSREAQRVRNVLKKKFWNPDTGFYRFAVLADGSYSEEKTVLSTVGMYLGGTNPERSQRSLAEFASERFTTDWGVRIVGNDHPSYKPSGYHSGSIWPLFTGWTALAEFACHRPLQGYGHFLSNASLFSQFSAGCVEEVLDGESFMPAGVCPHQAWSESMVLQPLFEGMLGLRSDGTSGTIIVRPFLPPGWDYLDVTNIPVDGALVGLRIRRTSEETAYTFSCRRPRGTSGSMGAITVVLEPLFPLGTSLLETTIDDRRIGRPSEITGYVRIPHYRLRLERSVTVRFRHRLGIALVVEHPHFIKGERSEGLRIVDERWKRRTYELVLEGRQDREYLADVYDPSESIKRIEGGIALAREGTRLLVSIRFPEGAGDSYTRSTLRFTT